MTVVALLSEPPAVGCSSLADTTPLDRAEATELYTALLADSMTAVEESGGELLVNYRVPDGDAVDSDETTPEADEPGIDAADDEIEAALRDLADAALSEPDSARFEVQVGSSPAARIGNTISHLLETEGATSAAVLRPEAPFVRRTMVDAAAMKLRRNEVVLGPAPGGRIYFAGFTEPIDFENALSPPPIETLATRGAEAGYAVEFEAFQPLLGTESDFATILPLLDARRTAGVPIPTATAAVLDDFDLVFDDDGLFRQ